MMMPAYLWMTGFMLAKLPVFLSPLVLGLVVAKVPVFLCVPVLGFVLAKLPVC